MSESVKLTIAVTTLGILEGNICVAARTYERGERVQHRRDWRTWALLKRVWSYSVNILSFMVRIPGLLRF